MVVDVAVFLLEAGLLHLHADHNPCKVRVNTVILGSVLPRPAHSRTAPDVNVDIDW